MGFIGEIADAGKKLAEISQRLSDAELQGIVADLTLTIANLKLESAERIAENTELRQENQQLRTQTERRSKIELRDGYYYLTEDIPGYSRRPYCPMCFDEDGKLITMRHVSGDKYFCDRCQSSGLDNC